MGLDHFIVKIFFKNNKEIEPSESIKIFHSWIQKNKLKGTLIDVVDYSHVENGPGVMLIGYESDYSVEEGAEQKNGFRFASKISQSDGKLLAGTQQKLQDAIADAIVACKEFQNEECWGGDLSFDLSHFMIMINDRMLAPNTIETFEKHNSDLQEGLESALSHSDFKLNYVESDSRSLFSVAVELGTELRL